MVLRLLLACCLATTLFAGEAGSADHDALRANLLKAGQAIEAATKGEVVAFLGTRPAVEGDASLTKPAAFLTVATVKAVLRAGVRGLDGEAGHPVTARYVAGKLPSGVLFTPEDVTYWQKTKQARFVLQSVLTSAKDRLKLRWQLIDLDKGKVASAIDLPPVPTALIDTEPNLDLLPDFNACLLLQAGDNIGVKIHRGECWDIAGPWLAEHGYRPNSLEYDFGQEVPITEALPGDVLSIDANGFHHVMLLVQPTAELKDARIYHQNANGKRFVVIDTFPQKMRNGLKVWRPGKLAGG